LAAGALVLERPASADELAAVLAEGRAIRPVGGRTKIAWGGVGPAPEAEVSTDRLNALVEHNEGDLTAVLQAGLRLCDAQESFAAAGQRLALDPPDVDQRATIGGLVATADSGPLRHRYGGVRELILGVQVALPDGTVARAGSRVIKNVAGYDLAKLMCGAFGTLGVVCEIVVRLHPEQGQTVTIVGVGEDPARLAAAAGSLRRLPLELEALDVRWDGTNGAILAQAAGRAASAAAEVVSGALRAESLEIDVVEADEQVWASQRGRQRTDDPEKAIVRVSFAPAELERVLRAAPEAVGRAGAGLAWVAIAPEPEALDALRTALAPCACVLLDAPASMRVDVDVWGRAEGPELALMERVKARFDPDAVCNRGVFVGGL
jgi:glycolate oxidase FAD binding subunit